MPTPTSGQRGLLKKCQGQGWICTICPAVASGQPSFSNFKAALYHERTIHDRKPSALKDDWDCNGDGIGVPANLQTPDESCWDKIGQPRLTSEGLRQWEMHAHVDQVFDLVPFWQRGIDAAEKGEVLRLEEFLEKMEGDGGWRTTNEVLGMLGGWKVSSSERARGFGGWGQPKQEDWAASQRAAWGADVLGWAASQKGGWSVGSNRIASDATESSRRRDNGWGIREKWAEDESEFNIGRGKKDGWGTRARIKTLRVVGGGREELHQFADAIARQEAVNEERRKQMHMFFEIPMEQKIQKIKETIRFLRTHN